MAPRMALDYSLETTSIVGIDEVPGSLPGMLHVKTYLVKVANSGGVLAFDTIEVPANGIAAVLGRPYDGRPSSFIGTPVLVLHYEGDPCDIISLDAILPAERGRDF